MCTCTHALCPPGVGPHTRSTGTRVSLAPSSGDAPASIPGRGLESDHSTVAIRTRRTGGFRRAFSSPFSPRSEWKGGTGGGGARAGAGRGGGAVGGGCGGGSIARRARSSAAVIACSAVEEAERGSTENSAALSQSIQFSRPSGRAPVGEGRRLKARSRAHRRCGGAGKRGREGKNLKEVKKKKVFRLHSCNTIKPSRHQTSLFKKHPKPNRHDAFRPRGTSVRACEYPDLGNQRVFFVLGGRKQERARAAFF